jgi:hypothetical protein
MKLNIWTTKENIKNFDIFGHLESLNFRVTGCELEGSNTKTI